jgi:hypothetical protein
MPKHTRKATSYFLEIRMPYLRGCNAACNKGFGKEIPSGGGQAVDMEESASNAPKQAEKAFARAKRILAACSLPGDPRTSAVQAILEEMLREHKAVLQLCRSTDFHSAIQLGRKIIVHLCQGVWLCFCAANSELIDDCLEKILPRSALRMAQQIDASCRGAGNCGSLRKQIWSIVGRNAHWELEQAGRRKTRRGIEPPYEDEELQAVVVTSSACVLLLATNLLPVS